MYDIRLVVVVFMVVGVIAAEEEEEVVAAVVVVVSQSCSGREPQLSFVEVSGRSFLFEFFSACRLLQNQTRTTSLS